MEPKDVNVSPFANTHGALVLFTDEVDGRRYLKMEDCSCGADYFGPLDDDEVEAFNVLCGVTRVSAY